MSPQTDRSPGSHPTPGSHASVSSLPPRGGEPAGIRGEGLPRAGWGHTYARRDYLCLDCIVPGGCHPSSVLCLWRADRRRQSDRGELDALDDPPELELSHQQRHCYDLLAAVRDLGTLGEVTASLVGRALGSDERNIATRLRRLAALDLVTYDFGHVVLTGAGRRLLDTLQIYAVNLQPGPRLLIRARGCYSVKVLTRPHSSSSARSSVCPRPHAAPISRRP